LAGSALDGRSGPNSALSSGGVAYGFWAVPKKGATVIIGFLYDDYNQRFYLGSYFPEHSNRSLPAGRNSTNGPTTDTDQQLQPATKNLQDQFQGNLTASEAQTRGVSERQVAQASTIKDGAEGYQPSAADAKTLDPQTYCWVTPGHHAIIMQDSPTSGRVRVKTAEGHQVILDDANERIYISTAKGNNWIEMDQDGRIYIYSGGTVSIAAARDLNLTAGGDINIAAGGSFNVSASKDGLIAACGILGLSTDGDAFLTSGGQLNLKAASNILQTGNNIHLNGPMAAEAPCPVKTDEIPQKEPWKRPATAGTRNPHWKE
jgi:hypothetical protein